MAVFPTKQSFPSLESNRIAVSKQGQVAVIKERCIQLYGRDVTSGIPWMVRKISASLSRPSDLCFAPNEALVVSDVGDNTIKIFDLTRNLQPVNQIIIGHDFFGMFIVLDRRNVPHFDMRALRTFRIPQNVAISSGPSSQLFVSSGMEVIVINMDWSKQSLVSHLLICSPLDWRLLQVDKRLVCDNASSVQDHKNSHEVGGFNPMACPWQSQKLSSVVCFTT